MIKRHITLLIVALLVLTAKAQVSVEQKIDSFAIYIGQQTALRVSVTAPKGHAVVFPNFTPSQELVPGIEVLHADEEETAELDNGMQKTTKSYTLTSFDEKLYSLPGLKVKVNNKEYEANILALKVVTMDVDTLHPNQFFPPKDVQNNPFSWTEEPWASIFYLSVLMLLLAALGVYLLVRLKQNKPVITRIRIVKKILPHQKAMTAIERIKAEKMTASENQKEYYTQLTDALRQYINERFGFNAMEMTSAEIIEHLNANGNQEMMNELKEIFQTADLVKFAKYATLINENDLNLVNAIEFIDKTKIENQPDTERIVPELTEADKRTKQTRVVLKTVIWAIAVCVVAIMVYIVYSLYDVLG